MVTKVGVAEKVPKTHPHRVPGVNFLVEHYFRAWESKRLASAARADAARADAAAAADAAEIPPCMAFSRKIGVGCREIADRVALKKGCKVVDRELIEYIANQTEISEKAIAFFDERFPGYVNRTAKYLFGEKSFIDSDYARQLIGAVTGIAALEPTLFVGRGAHLILPRERVLAVRYICSDEMRIDRIAESLRISFTEAKKRLPDIDKSQRDFFRKTFGKKTASAYEFDLVINRDHFTDIDDIADIVSMAYDRKFKLTSETESLSQNDTWLET
jgi:hypothetical protein